MSPRAPHLALVIACLGVLVAGAACSGRAAKPGAGGPAVAHPAAVSLDPLAAMALSHDEVWRRLGPHQFQAKSTLQVTAEGQPPDRLEEEYLLEAGTAGAFHAKYENSQDQGREIVLHGSDLFVRPRYGTFVRRHPEEGEADRLRAETFGG